MNTVINWTYVLIAGTALALGGVVGWFAYPLEHPAPSPTPPAPPVPSGYIGAPAKVTAPVGRQVEIDTTGTAQSVYWRLLAPPVKSGSPVDLTPINNGKSVIFTTAAAGTYWLSAAAIQGTSIVEEQTEVDAGAGPTPPGPLPSDPFFTNLTQAWLADTDPNKNTNRNILAGMYLDLANSLPATVVSWNDLHTTLLAKEKEVLPTAFAAERKVCGDYLTGALPIGQPSATTVDKALVTATFTKVANYLNLLK